MHDPKTASVELLLLVVIPINWCVPLGGPFVPSVIEYIPVQPIRACEPIPISVSMRFDFLKYHILASVCDWDAPLVFKRYTIDTFILSVLLHIVQLRSISKHHHVPDTRQPMHVQEHPEDELCNL